MGGDGDSDDRDNLGTVFTAKRDLFWRRLSSLGGRRGFSRIGVIGVWNPLSRDILSGSTARWADIAATGTSERKQNKTLMTERTPHSVFEGRKLRKAGAAQVL